MVMYMTQRFYAARRSTGLGVSIVGTDGTGGWLVARKFPVVGLPHVIAITPDRAVSVLEAYASVAMRIGRPVRESEAKSVWKLLVASANTARGEQRMAS